MWLAVLWPLEAVTALQAGTTVLCVAALQATLLPVASLQAGSTVLLPVLFKLSRPLFLL